MNPDSKVYIAGHTGLVGSALLRLLAARGFHRVVTRPRAELDLTDAAAVGRFFQAERPEVVILAAARVGGIRANSTYPADFIRENLLISLNVVQQAFATGARSLVHFGSGCMYPKLCPQPMKEEHILTGPPEETNAAYALAKLAGAQLCHSYNQQHGTRFIVPIPANLYGPGDNFHPEDSHVIPGLLRRFHEAKLRGDGEVVIWGSGKPRREFLFVDDLAAATLFLVEQYSENRPINVGYGSDVSVLELAEAVRRAVGYAGSIQLDVTKPDGMPRKFMDSSRLTALGWRPSVGLEEGLRRTYQDYLVSSAVQRKVG